MMPSVGHEDAGLVLARREADLGEIAGRRLEGRRERRRVAFVGRMDRRRHHDAGVEIDRVLRFVGQMRLVLSGDLRLGVGRALPIRVRQRLAPALAVEARQVLGARRVDPAPLSPSSSASRDSSRRRAPARSCAARRWPRSSSRRCRICSPFTGPCSATSLNTKPNTFSCASCGRRERVRDSHE